MNYTTSNKNIKNSISSSRTLNKRLLDANKSSLNDKEINAVNKQQIVNQIADLGFDFNDQLALIINLLADNIDSLKNSKHKTEFLNFLNARNQIKKDVKGE